jgi:hypothetical protein
MLKYSPATVPSGDMCFLAHYVGEPGLDVKVLVDSEKPNLNEYAKPRGSVLRLIAQDGI